MANPIADLRNDIAASLYIAPCTLKELMSREFLKTTSLYGVESSIQVLENKEAIYYTGKGEDEVIHVYKKWAKTNLKEYEID